MAERDAKKVAEGLTEAQKRYLRELEPNEPRDTPDNPWIGATDRRLKNRRWRSELRGNKLATAHAAKMQNIVVQKGAYPVECGSHYADLTPLGLAVRDHLRGEQ